MEQYLARYYELDQLKKQIEQEMEKMKRELLQTFPGPIERTYGKYHLKIYLQDRGAYDLQKVYPLLPSEELRLYVSNPNNANIKELAKKGVLSETDLADTYQSKPTAVVSVKEVK
jgi:hypothetical protein